MAYFYDNNVRKIPGPSYLFDLVYKTKVPGELTSEEIKADEKLNAIQIGRYILYSPAEPDSYSGTAWQKVVKEDKVQFALVADKYTNPVEGLTGDEMETIWGHVWGDEDDEYL